MFEVNEELFNQAATSNYNALQSLQTKAGIIKVLNEMPETYPNKEDVLGICKNLFDITADIVTLDSKMTGTKKAFGWENSSTELSDPDSLDTTFSNAVMMQAGDVTGLDGQQNLNATEDGKSYEEIIVELKGMAAQQILDLFAPFELSEEDRAKILEWIKEENTEAILFFLLKLQKENERKKLSSDKAAIDEDIEQLEFYLRDQSRGNGSLIDLSLSAISSFLTKNKDNPDAIVGQTFTIAGEEVSFTSYEEGMEFIRTYKEKKQKELEGLKAQSAVLDREIKELNVKISQIDANIEFYDNFTYAYRETNDQDETFEDFLGFAHEMGLDLDNCTISEAFTLLGNYCSANPDSYVNPFLFIDYIKGNSKYKNVSEEKFQEEFSIERTDFSIMFSGNANADPRMAHVLNMFMDLDDIYYDYMTEEEKVAYGVILAKEGWERADYYLDVITRRSLNARKGMEEGYQIFKDIVSSPGKLRELGNAYLQGGWIGLVGHVDNLFSLATTDYGMTVNDYKSRTIQQLFQVMILSYQPVDETTFTTFENEYGIDPETASKIRREIEARKVNGEDFRYYELLGYLPEEEGGLSENEITEYEQMFESIDGGEFYTKYVLKSAYSAGASTGNMLPSIALGMIPGIGPYLAKASFFASAAGGTYREQRRTGADWGDAMLAGSIDGALEIGTEYFIGGIPFLSKNDVGLDKLLKMSFTEKALFMGKEILGEEAEEALQLFGGDYILSRVTGEPYDLGDQFSQLPETVVSTFISTLALNSLSYGTQTAVVYGGTTINLTAEDWANLYTEGFNATNFKHMLDNKIKLNLGQSTSANNSEVVLTSLTQALKDNGLDAEIEYKNGQINVNGVVYTPSEFSKLVTLSDPSTRSQNNNQEFLNMIRMTSNFSQEERIALDKINPNWRNELTVFEARDLIKNSVDSTDDIPLAAPSLSNNSDDRVSLTSVMIEKLNQAKQVLDTWGKARGQNNYANLALLKYAKTGSVYTDNSRGASYITSSNGVRAFIETLDPSLVLKYLNVNMNTDVSSRKNMFQKLNSFFENNQSKYDAYFGVDQGSIEQLCIYVFNGKEYTFKEAERMIDKALSEGKIPPRFQKKTISQEYNNLKQLLISKGFNSNQASTILSSIDTAGACTYSTIANSIFYRFSDNPKLFEKKFGFPMYKINTHGETVLNANRLLLDIYLFANDTVNGGSLISKRLDGSYDFNIGTKVDCFGRPLLDTNKQNNLLRFSTGLNNQVLGSYFASKGLGWGGEILASNNAFNIVSDSEFNGYLEAARSSIESGKSVILGLSAHGNPIRLIGVGQTRPTMLSGGHAVYVVGMTNQGFLVSSWGNQYLIPFIDLKNGAKFNMSAADIY